jgi:hypothetical protein
MEQEKSKKVIDYRVITIENQPRIYVFPPADEVEAPATKKLQEKDRKEGKGVISFFGRHLEKIFASTKSPEAAVPPIEQELEMILEGVQKKLKTVQAVHKTEMDVMSRERLKHEKLIENRNRSQEFLFVDIVELHRKFGTGINKKGLWSLHAFMKNAAAHETECSSQDLFHKHIECNVMGFLREKALGLAWERLEDYMDRFGISFPVPESMLDHEDNVRNAEVREERKKTAGAEFRKMPPQQIAEMILGNIPVWVYSYPEKGSYLWLLTALQGVAAGLAARFFLEHLGYWEKNSPQLLKKIAQTFNNKIKMLRERGEKAVDLSEVFNVSRDLRQMSKEDIPAFIWNEISIHMKNGSSLSQR